MLTSHLSHFGLEKMFVLCFCHFGVFFEGYFLCGTLLNEKH